MKIDIMQFDLHEISHKKCEKELKGGEIKKVSRQFESMFIFEMLKAMRKTVPENPILGKGLGSDVFTTLFDMHIADMASERDGTGLASIIEKYLTREK